MLPSVTPVVKAVIVVSNPNVIVPAALSLFCKVMLPSVANNVALSVTVKSPVPAVRVIEPSLAVPSEFVITLPAANPELVVCTANVPLELPETTPVIELCATFTEPLVLVRVMLPLEPADTAPEPVTERAPALASDTEPLPDMVA